MLFIVYGHYTIINNRKPTLNLQLKIYVIFISTNCYFFIIIRKNKAFFLFVSAFIYLFSHLYLIECLLQENVSVFRRPKFKGGKNIKPSKYQIFFTLFMGSKSYQELQTNICSHLSPP